VQIYSYYLNKEAKSIANIHFIDFKELAIFNFSFDGMVIVAIEQTNSV
jgi:hypothetical protein